MRKHLALTIILMIQIATNLCHAQSDTVELGRGTLVGQVIYQDSYLPFAQLSIYQNNRLIKKTRADSNGKYLFKSLAPGSYKLKAVTTHNDVLVSKSVIVTNSETDFAMCDEFFLLNKRATQRKMTYIDTPLKQDIDSILVLKQKREMYVYNHKKLLKVYHVCLGFAPVGAKHYQGDGKTPEGLYKICDKNLQSQYHKSLGVSYPNEADTKYALAAHKPSGGDIKIHGLPNGDGQNKEAYIYDDWTWGCIALTDEEVDEVFAHTALKTAILILP